MRRLIRFGVEVAFLVALAAALVLAEAEPLVIAGAMLAGWAVVALFEWAGMRSRPHYGSGLPPRYYVPQVSLPPPRPLEQLRTGYPVSGDRDEEATWIAPPEVLENWPVGGAAPVTAPPSEPREPLPAPSVSEDTMVDELLPLGLHEPKIDPWFEGPLDEDEDEREPEPELEPVPEPVVEEPVSVEAAVVEAILVEEVVDGAVVEAVVVEETALRATTVPVIETHGESASGFARHRLDPLGEPAPRRRLSRRQAEDGAVVEVPARPERPRALPGRASRERSD